MNKGTVPIVARLLALQRPAVVAAGGARVLADANDPNPMTALMRELNETILARSLRIESSSGSALTLEVAGRRVLRLTEATGLAGAEACLAAPALEDDLKDDLIKLMQAVAAPRHELRVTSLSSIETGERVSVGLPVALLADLLLVELNEADLAEAATSPAASQLAARVPLSRRLTEAAAPIPAAPAPVEKAAPVVSAGRSLGRFAHAMGPTLSAWLILGGDDDGASEGPDEMVQHLRGFLGDEADPVLLQLDLVADRPGAPVCAILGAALIDGQSVLCARSGKGLLLGVLDGNATQPLLAAWAEARL